MTEKAVDDALRLGIGKRISRYLVGSSTERPVNLRPYSVSPPALRGHAYGCFVGAKDGENIGFRIAATVVVADHDRPQHIGASIRIAITDADAAVCEIWHINDPDTGSAEPDARFAIGPAPITLPDGSRRRIPNDALNVAALWVTLAMTTEWTEECDLSVVTEDWFTLPKHCENRSK